MFKNAPKNNEDILHDRILHLNLYRVVNKDVFVVYPKALKNKYQNLHQKYRDLSITNHKLIIFLYHEV